MSLSCSAGRMRTTEGSSTSAIRHFGQKNKIKIRDGELNSGKKNSERGCQPPKHVVLVKLYGHEETRGLGFEFGV